MCDYVLPDGESGPAPSLRFPLRDLPTTRFR
jgi:hypothetical protein